MDTITDARPGLGHNNPPDPIEILRSDLRDKHADMKVRHDELVALLDRLPEEMDDEWEARFSDAIKACLTFEREAEAQRLAAARPYRALIAAIDGFFHGLSGDVSKVKKRLNDDFQTPYKLAKEAAERRRREEEARIAREKAAEAARIAAEEERLKREAREREEAARREQERLKREREEEARRRAEAERKARDEAEARRVAAIRAEEEARSKRAREKAAREREAAEREERERQAKAREEQRIQREKEREAREAAARDAEAAREARRAQERAAAIARDEAAAAERERNKTSRAERASAAELSRNRSDLGAVSSLKTVWTFEVEEPSLVPREYLEIDEGAINRAIKAATHDGKCDLTIPGCRIFPMRDAVTR